MEVMYARCCGIDVHKQTVVACVMVPDAKGQVQKETRTYATMSGDLTALAQWLKAADLLRHGLLRGSFIPSAQQRALRDLTRYRTTLTDERSQEVNRVQKVLEDASLKLASVATDVMGISGRAILNELLHGHTEPALLAELAKGRLREKRALLEQALAGTLQPHHRFLLIQHLSHIDFLDEQLAKLDAEIAEQIRPF